MTPKEKAKELINGCFEIIGSSYSGYMITACEIALFFVTMTKSLNTLKDREGGDLAYNHKQYWDMVEDEIVSIKNELS